jgi:hypothetical protein
MSRKLSDMYPYVIAPPIEQEWERKTTNFTAESGKGYTVGTGVTITLPANPADHDRIFFAPLGDMTTSNAIVNRNGKKIMGLAENLIWNIKTGFSIIFDTTNTDWRLL